MKKITALLLVLTVLMLSVSILSSCGGGKADATGESTAMETVPGIDPATDPVTEPETEPATTVPVTEPTKSDLTRTDFY